MPHYRFIRYPEARGNPEYLQFFQHQFEERAALIIQHLWRKQYYRKCKNHAGKVRPAYCHSMGFIKEPESNQMQVYAEKINAGDWLSLNFNDEDFVRHLSKALRLKLINLNQMAMGLLLHETKTQFEQPKFQQFRFDDVNGHYSFENISYAQSGDIERFKKNIGLLPNKEQIYFCINFSRQDEAILIFDCITKHKVHCSPNKFIKTKFVDMLGLYLRKWGVDKSNCESLKSGLLHPNYDDFVKKAEHEIVNLIHLFEPQLYSILHYKDLHDDTLFRYRASFSFLANMIGVGEQIPQIEISPLHNEYNNTPTFCFILPYISAFLVMQQSLHGKHATRPVYLPGQFSPRLLRKLDEKPDEDKQSHSGRGIELYHPDVVNSSKLHGGEISTFMTTWHDMFHVWRNGANVHKPMYRYLRNLFQTITGYDMSKIIWRLTDMDSNSGWLCREAEKANSKDAILLANNYAFYDMLGCVDEKFWQGEVNNDNVLVVLIDMIHNKRNWSIFSEQLKLFLESSEPPRFPWLCSRKIGTQTSAAHQFLKDCMQKHAYTGKAFYVFYILCYRLRALDDKGLSLCQKLGEIELDKVVQWKRNAGLCLVDKPKIKIAEMKSDELYEELSSAVESRKSTFCSP